MTKIYAKDKKCCNCKKQAVAFWPYIDPDIKSSPYCEECLYEAKEEAMIKLMESKNL